MVSRRRRERERGVGKKRRKTSPNNAEARARECKHRGEIFLHRFLSPREKDFYRLHLFREREREIVGTGEIARIYVYGVYTPGTG